MKTEPWSLKIESRRQWYCIITFKISLASSKASIVILTTYNTSFVTTNEWSIGWSYKFLFSNWLKLVARLWNPSRSFSNNKLVLTTNRVYYKACLILFSNLNRHCNLSHRHQHLSLYPTNNILGLSALLFYSFWNGLSKICYSTGWWVLFE